VELIRPVIVAAAFYGYSANYGSATDALDPSRFTRYTALLPTLEETTWIVRCEEW